MPLSLKKIRIKRIFLICMVLIPLTELSIVIAEESPFNYDDHGKRDPFWRLVNQAGAIINYDKDLSISDMSLEGIIIGESGNNIAIINGNIVKEGDLMGRYYIKKIDVDTVTLQKGNENFVLKLKKEE